MNFGKLVGSFAFDPDDTGLVRSEKQAIFLVAGSCTIAGAIWTAMYYVFFGWGLTAFLPAGFVIIVGASLVISQVTKNHYYAIYAQIICIIYVTTFIQWSIGGVLDSGFVMAWAFCGPIVALMFFSSRQSTLWFLLYVLNLAITVIFNDFFASHGQVVADSTKQLFFFMNLTVSSIVVFSFAGYYMHTAIIERSKARAAQQRAQRLQTQVERLKIEIDLVKQSEQIKEITENDYFQNLQERAELLRQKRSGA